MSTPTADLDPRYSEPEAEALSWDEASEILAAAELSWITTVRPDGTPHVTPRSARRATCAPTQRWP
jgi:hypothetical protein